MKNKVDPFFWTGLKKMCIAFRRCWLILLLMGAGLPGISAHLKGGYIEYKYLGPTPNVANSSRYKIIVYQYLDCGSTSGQIDTDVNIGVFVSPAVTAEQLKIVPITASNFINVSNFDCIINPSPVCYRIDSYETEMDFMDRATPYIITVQRCCRIQNVANVSGSGTAGITYTIQLNTNRASGAPLTNSSPVFAQKDAVIVCANNGFTFPLEATDPDGDELRYSFTGGLNTPSNEAKPYPPLAPPFASVFYNNGFSAQTPLGSNVTINPATGLITGTAPGISGEYVVAVIVEEFRQGVKIGEGRKELHLTVGNCDIPRAELPIRIINCEDFTVDFENGSNSSGILTYDWDFGVAGTNTDVSTAPKPSFTYPDTGVYIATLTVNKTGKCPDVAKTEVRVFPGFKPAFKIEGVCQQLPYQFTDLTTANYGTVNTWFWNFGDPQLPNDTSNRQNPAFSYTTPGTYTVSMAVATSKGCTDTVLQELEVLERPRVQLAFRDTLICSIDSLPLQAIGTGNFTWTPSTNIINANTASPVVFPKTTTTYYVLLNDRGCTASDSVTVNVLSFITINAGPDTTICRTDGFLLRPNSQALSFNWQPAALFDNNRLKNPTITPTDSLTTVVVNANLGKCQASDTLRIVTVPYPVVSAGADTTICFGSAAQLLGSGNGSIVSWQTRAGLSTPNSYVTAARPTATTTYTLTVRDTRGCPKPVQDQVQITVRPRITLFAGNDTSVVFNQMLQLDARTNAPQINWTPGTALSSSTIANPTAIFGPGTLPSGIDSIRYVVTAQTSEGCQASDDILIKIFSTAPGIFVPSGFTPNADGLNDVLRPTLAGMSKLNFFRIYNRYGQLVFETRTPGKGWDGRLNGEPQGSGAYVYQCNATDFEGKTVVVKGSFVLIR